MSFLLQNRLLLLMTQSRKKINDIRLGNKMSSEGYFFTWNGHQRTIVAAFGRFLKDDRLVDCTMAAEGECLKAHRLMLSACSSYFEFLFSQEMKKEKVVVLEDIKFEILKSLVAFMYQGQVTVPKDRLRDFVRAAERLQIKGLPSDLVQNSQRQTSDMPVLCTIEGLASHHSHERMRCSGFHDESNSMQCLNLNASSIGRTRSGDERFFPFIQTDLLEANMFPQPPSDLESNSNRDTAVFPADEESLVEAKEEVDVDGTPIWESGDENTSTVTGISSATAGKEIRNVLTPVLDTANGRSSNANSPHILEESESCVPKFSSVSATIPSAANLANTSFLPNTPTEQDCDAKEDFSSCVQTEVTEQRICVENNSAVNPEVFPVADFSHSECVVKPMHEVWVDEMRSWEGDDAMIETDETYTTVICNQETTKQDLDVAVVASDNIGPAVWHNFTFKAAASSSDVVRRDKKEVNARDVKIDLEINKQLTEHECKSISDRAIDKEADNGWHSVIEIDGDDVGKEKHVMEGQMMVGTEEKTLGTNTVVVLKNKEKDSIPLSGHISKLLEKKSHKCFRCPDVFHTIGELQLHVMKQHWKGCSYRCGMCLATFPYRSNLTEHMKMHVGERPHQCDVCKMSFFLLAELIVHKLKHTDERHYQCDVCKMSFSCVDTLTAHERKHIGEHLQCYDCTMSFRSKSLLDRHIMKHSGERLFQCNDCTMSFRSKFHLNRHMLKHTGERPFQCDVCKKSFSQACNLAVHKRKHTGERPFQCYICKRSFTVKYILMNHLRTHNAEHPS